jgi:hypothetical protein
MLEISITFSVIVAYCLYRISLIWAETLKPAKCLYSYYPSATDYLCATWQMPASNAHLIHALPFLAAIAISTLTVVILMNIYWAERKARK